jgi:hypothetical protein
MLVNVIVGKGGGATTTEEAEEDGAELEEDAVEGDADDDGDDVVGAWCPVPLRLRIGILGLMMSSPPLS